MSHVNFVQAVATAASIAVVTFPIIGITGRHVLRTLKLHVEVQTDKAVDSATETLQHELKDRFEKNDERFDKNDESTEAARKLAADLQLELARQFGGNSGGIRQAINEQRSEIAHLQGAFEQHMKESGR